MQLTPWYRTTTPLSLSQKSELVMGMSLGVPSKRTSWGDGDMPLRPRADVDVAADVAVDALDRETGGSLRHARSCRKLEAACRDQIPYLWLTGWQHPDHNTLWRFYRGHRQAMRKLFERTVRTAVTMKLVDLAVQAVEGTKVVANASLNRSYDAEGLRGLLERLGECDSRP